MVRNEAISKTNSYKMKYGGCVYILTNKHHTVLYTGVTSDLKKRIWQHQNKEFKSSFTSKYNCDKLVYYENLLGLKKQLQGKSKSKAEIEKRKRI